MFAGLGGRSGRGLTIFERWRRAGPVSAGCAANGVVCDRVRFNWVPLRANARLDTTPSAKARSLANG